MKIRDNFVGTKIYESLPKMTIFEKTLQIQKKKKTSNVENLAEIHELVIKIAYLD